MTQYKELFMMIGNYAIAIVFLLIGYAMGRNSIDKPVIAVPKPKPAKEPPYHDDQPSLYDEALMSDQKQRIDTI